MSLGETSTILHTSVINRFQEIKQVSDLKLYCCGQWNLLCAGSSGGLLLVFLLVTRHNVIDAQQQDGRLQRNRGSEWRGGGEKRRARRGPPPRFRPTLTSTAVLYVCALTARGSQMPTAAMSHRAPVSPSTPHEAPSCSVCLACTPAHKHAREIHKKATGRETKLNRQRETRAVSESSFFFQASVP